MNERLKAELYRYLTSDEYMNTREDGDALIAQHFYNLALEEVRKEVERRILQGEQGFEDGDAEYGYKTCLKDLKRFINSLKDESQQSYDPDYLQSCIDKAKKSWEGVDVDKFIDDVRGSEPVRDCHGLEDETVRYFSEL